MGAPSADRMGNSTQSAGGMDKSLVSAGGPALVRVMVFLCSASDYFSINTDKRPEAKASGREACLCHPRCKTQASPEKNEGIPKGRSVAKTPDGVI